MSEPLKVTHFTGPIRLELGGVVRAVLDMTLALAQAGHDVVIVTWDKTDVPEDWRNGKLGVPRVVEIEPPGKLGKLSKRSEGLLKRAVGASDIVHMHTPWETANASVAKLCKGLGVPYVVSIHGMLDDWSMAQRTLKKRLYLALTARKFLQDAHAVHCTAQAELDQSQKWYPKGKGVVIPLLFDLEPYKQLPGPDIAREKFDIDPNKPAVLFLSRIHVKKGVHHLIDAAKRLRDRGTDAQFLIAGTGDSEYEQSLQAQIGTLKLGDSVRLLGMVKGEEKVSLFQAADIFALPTSQENFGFVLVEALASATPTITTKHVDIWPELESSGSSLIVEQTAEAFEEAITELLADRSALKSMGTKGRDWVLTALDPRVVLGGYESLYREARRR
ncbi:MAG: glycosyltransferase [Phycisphaera sp.]|nr:MAG: glycosyltransferase [Phycisphaera sp.]